MVREKKSINGENGGLGKVIQLPALREGEEMEGLNGKPRKWVGKREIKKKKKKIKENDGRNVRGGMSP